MKIPISAIFKGILFPFCIVAFPICGSACISSDWFGNASSTVQELVAEDPREDEEWIFDAIQKKRVGNVERLLARGVSPEERDLIGLTPLLYAVENKAPENIILALIKGGASLEAADSKGNTPLLKCCESEGCASIAKILLEHGADKEVRNNLNKTVLMLCAELNRVKLASDLLAAGAMVDSRDTNGMTPLMYASYKGHIAIAQILLQHGADVSAQSTGEVIIVTKNPESLFSYSYLFPYRNQTIVPPGSTAFTFAELFGGKGTEKVLLEAWAKKDPSIEPVLMEWKKKLYEI